MPTERPIIFSGAMVRAILAGQKSQTRRVIKPQPVATDPAECGDILWRTKNGWGIPSKLMSSEFAKYERCPYGQPGDQLWVRETWAEIDYLDTCNGVPYDQTTIAYRANGEDQISRKDGERWRPSIYMPRHASRILLRVEDVRVQRVQEISEEDACAEGVASYHQSDAVLGNPAKENKWAYWTKRIAGDRGERMPSVCTDLGAYAMLWQEINAKRGYPWESNPWVWAITFSVEEANQ